MKTPRLNLLSLIVFCFFFVVLLFQLNSTTAADQLAINNLDTACAVYLPYVGLNAFPTFEVEPNNGLSAANGPLKQNITYYGKSNDSPDIFYISDVGVGRLEVTLNDYVGQSVQISLIDANASIIHFVNWPSSQILAYDIQSAGTYYIQISNKGIIDPNAIYNFKVSYTEQSSRVTLNLGSNVEDVAVGAVAQSNNCVDQEGWELVESFEDLEMGTIDGKNDWRSTGGAKVKIDPADPNNQILGFDELETRSYKALPNEITDSSVGTLFFRLRREGIIDGFGGLSDIITPDAWSDYETQFGAQTETTTVFTVRDNDLFKTTPDSDMFKDQTWYCVWIVVDNSNDSYRVYLQGDTFQERTLVRTVTDENTFNFRNGGNNALKTFYARTGDEVPGQLMIDDIFVTHDSVNYSMPIETCS